MYNNKISNNKVTLEQAAKDLLKAIKLQEIKDIRKEAKRIKTFANSYICKTV